MDQGVIAWMKKRYKYQIVKELYEILSNEERRTAAIASRRPGGFDGVAQAIRPNILDAMERLDKIWNDIKDEFIVKCWQKARCMSVPPVVQAPVAPPNNNAQVTTAPAPVITAEAENATVSNNNSTGNSGEQAVEGDCYDTIEDVEMEDVARAENTASVQLVEDKSPPDLASYVELLCTAVCGLDFSNDQDTKSIFVGTAFLEGNNSADDIARQWVQIHDKEENKEVYNAVMEECCAHAEKEAIVAEEMLHADAQAQRHVQAEKATDEAAEVVEVEAVGATTEDAAAADDISNAIDIDESNNLDDTLDEDCLKQLSASKMIKEIQYQVDHVTDALLFINKNKTFGESDDAQRLVDRMEQLTCGFEHTLTSLQQLEHETKQLKKRQGKVTGFFMPANKK